MQVKHVCACACTNLHKLCAQTCTRKTPSLLCKLCKLSMCVRARACTQTCTHKLAHEKRQVFCATYASLCMFVHTHTNLHKTRKTPSLLCNLCKLSMFVRAHTHTQTCTKHATHTRKTPSLLCKLCKLSMFVHAHKLAQNTKNAKSFVQVMQVKHVRACARARVHKLA
jgi:hypothetical protein